MNHVRKKVNSCLETRLLEAEISIAAHKFVDFI